MSNAVQEKLIEDGANALRSISVPLATILETSGSYTYVGKAVPGTVTSAAKWQIMRIDESVTDTMTITWADGNKSFDNVWTNRASLNYT